MIIWGSKNRQQTVTSGQFFCPKCATERQYKHVRVSRYFTLYFIPLFSTKALGEYVECQQCGQTYSLDVLKLVPPTYLQRPSSQDTLPTAGTNAATAPKIADAASELLRSGIGQSLMLDIAFGTPTAMIVATLATAGMPVEEAQSLESLVRLTFERLPVEEQMQVRDNMTKRMDTLDG
jgi:hypothetical protein